MPQKDRNRKFSRAALCAAFGIVLVVAGGTVVFAAMMKMTTGQTRSFIKGLLRGIGCATARRLASNTRSGRRCGAAEPRSAAAGRGRFAHGEQSRVARPDPDEKKRAAARKAKAERKPYDAYKAGDPLKPSELAAGRTDKPAMKNK